MKYLIALTLVALAYADPIYYKTSGVAPLPAFVRAAASPYFPYKWAGAFSTPAAAAASGYPVTIAPDDALNLNAAAKVLAFDQAAISAPATYGSANYAPASYAPYYKSFVASAAPASHVFAPAATRVYTAGALPTLDASVFPAAVGAEDSLSAAVKSLAIERANFGAASSYAPYYKSIVAAAPSSLASAPAYAVTEFAPAATRVYAPAGASAAHAINAFSPAAAMTEFAPAATRVYAPAGASAAHAINAFSPAAAMTEFAPAATRVYAPAGASAAHAINAFSPAAAMTEFAPAATRVFASAGFSAGDASNYAIHALSPAAAATNYAQVASRFFAPSAYATGAAASPAVYLADSDAYKINHPSPIVKVLSQS